MVGKAASYLPNLFRIYTEQLMKDPDIEQMQVWIAGRSLTDLRYADDTALLADNITSTRRILHRVDKQVEEQDWS